MRFKMPYKMMLMSKLTPTDVKIFYEDSVPFLDYIGTVETNYGTVKMHFPKIGLSFSAVETKSESALECPVYFAKQDMFVYDDKWYEFEIIDRKMTKDEIEKELGYKVTIVDK